MSTEFRTETTDEFAFIRWCGPDAPNYDFGCASRALAVRDALARGERFLGEDYTWIDAEAAEKADIFGRATFGAFGGTVALGTGEAFDRLNEHPFD